MSALAPLYGPAARGKPKKRSQRRSVFRFSIRPVSGTVAFLAIMDIRARSISFASRPRRPYGPPDHERAGETFSPSPHSDSQTSAGKPTLALGSAKAVPSEPPSLARPIWRATGATGVGGHPLGEPERVHQAAAFVTR